MAVPPRPCLSCGKPTPQAQLFRGRCRGCARGMQNKAGPRPTAAETKRRREAVLEHIRRWGYHCPGWGGTPPHPSTDLTADHIVPRSLGGEDGPLRVLCRSCNSRRSNQIDKH